MKPHQTKHRLQVPLDHARPDGPQIEIFARVLSSDATSDKPFLLYLQGGPGFASPRPAPASAWLDLALHHFRVVLLDQRGTGLSSPVFRPTLPPAEQAAYLSHFRADSIVSDAELLRKHLGAERWALLGQSFGGFCVYHYLGAFPDSVSEAYITGGLPAPSLSIDEVYRQTWDVMRRKSLAHYRRYPEDRRRMKNLMHKAADGELFNLSGVQVTPEMLRRVGMTLGRDGGSEMLHFFLEHAHDSPDMAAGLGDLLPFSIANPIYLVLHESCWMNGGVSNWAAERTMPQDFKDDPTLLAGEHVHRDFLLHDPAFTPWQETAEILAQWNWPQLYKPEVVEASETPVAAAIYAGDAFVPFEASLQTASPERWPALQSFITNEYEHGGLHSSGERVLARLMHLLGR